MTVDELQAGQVVIWKYAPRGGYGREVPVHARVLKVGKFRVQLEVLTKANQPKRISVMPNRLDPPMPEMSELESLRDRAIRIKMSSISKVLGNYMFTVNNEDELQKAVVRVLELSDSRATVGMTAQREVKASFGRYDILLESPSRVNWSAARHDEVSHPEDGIRIVLELKVKSGAAALERQSQRYALTPGISAVMLVTTSPQLAAQVTTGMLGGKPFGVIALRTAF